MKHVNGAPEGNKWLQETIIGGRKTGNIKRIYGKKTNLVTFIAGGINATSPHQIQNRKNPNCYKGTGTSLIYDRSEKGGEIRD